eukprot:Gb_03785 [translate_table: standard]
MFSLEERKEHQLNDRWAVDLNPHACESLKYNHPETEVRNEAAENFLQLIKEWKRLCEMYLDFTDDIDSTTEFHIYDSCDDEKSEDGFEMDDEEFEVEKLLAIRCVDSSLSNRSGIQFKVYTKLLTARHKSAFSSVVEATGLPKYGRRIDLRVDAKNDSKVFVTEEYNWVEWYAERFNDFCTMS